MSFDCSGLWGHVPSPPSHSLPCWCLQLKSVVGDHTAMICEVGSLRVLRPHGLPPTSSELCDYGSVRPMAPWPREVEGGGSLCSVQSRVTLSHKFTPPTTSQPANHCGAHCGFPRKARSPGLLPDHTPHGVTEGNGASWASLRGPK